MIARIGVNMIDDKITIVEGPPPTFEAVGETWALALNESPTLSKLAVTRLRTFNGNSLIERCQRAWSHQHPMRLEYRQSDGLVNEVPVIAARNLETPEGNVLLLWVRLLEQAELELGYEDDADDGPIE
jgi:hypothetical protein